MNIKNIEHNIVDKNFLIKIIKLLFERYNIILPISTNKNEATRRELINYVLDCYRYSGFEPFLNGESYTRSYFDKGQSILLSGHEGLKDKFVYTSSTKKACTDYKKPLISCYDVSILVNYLIFNDLNSFVYYYKTMNKICTDEDFYNVIK